MEKFFREILFQFTSFLGWFFVFWFNEFFFQNFRQEKLFSPTEEIYYRNAKEEDFHGNVLKRKYFKDVQDAKKRSKPLGQKIFTCLDGELYENDEVGTIFFYYSTIEIFKGSIVWYSRRKIIEDSVDIYFRQFFLLFNFHIWF